MKIKDIYKILGKKEPCSSFCNLYEVTLPVVYVENGGIYAYKNTDVADLLPFDDANRSGTSAVHYINWFEIDGENVLDANDLYTDCFRNRFTEASVGNRGELDLAGSSYASAKSWAKNLCKFVNKKFKEKGVFGNMYSTDSVFLSYNTEEKQFNLKFHINLHKKHVIGNLQQARYDVTEFATATNWIYNPLDDSHRYIPVFLQKIKCNTIKK